MKQPKPTKREQLYDYLDRLCAGKTELNFDNLNGNAWEMFERSIGDPTEVVCRWAIERGVKLNRAVKTIKVDYVEFDPQQELAERGYRD